MGTFVTFGLSFVILIVVYLDYIFICFQNSKASENKSEPVAKNDSKEKSDLLHPAWKVCSLLLVCPSLFSLLFILTILFICFQDSKASENKSELVAKNDSKEKSDLLHPGWKRKQWKSGP